MAASHQTRFRTAKKRRFQKMSIYTYEGCSLADEGQHRTPLPHWPGLPRAELYIDPYGSHVVMSPSEHSGLWIALP